LGIGDWELVVGGWGLLIRNEVKFSTHYPLPITHYPLPMIKTKLSNIDSEISHLQRVYR